MGGHLGSKEDGGTARYNHWDKLLDVACME